MAFTAVLFDLDGTLLPMDQEEFVSGYLHLLAEKATLRGYEPEALTKSVWDGVRAMVRNDGSRSNEDAFWGCFEQTFGREALVADRPMFDEFYAVEFQGARKFCGYNPMAAQVVARVKELGLRVACATNPVFPATATESRMGWAGLKPSDFELYTTYENSSSCKPNPAYYRDVAARLGVDPSECLMVGNDATEDMVAAEMGMGVFLLTDCLINTNNVDVSELPQGSFVELLEYLERSAR